MSGLSPPPFFDRDALEHVREIEAESIGKAQAQNQAGGPLACLYLPYRRPVNAGHSALAWSGIFAPKGAFQWVYDRGLLWNRAEAAERQQANGQPARNLEIGLPNELTREQQIRLLTDFVRENAARKGMIADAAIHSDYDAEGNLRPGADPDEPRNDHAHVLLTMRRLDGEGFAKTKTDARVWNSKEQLEDWREKWAKAGAKALRKAGFEQEAARFEVGHRTLPEQRRAAIERGDTAWAEHLDREPDMKQGAAIMQMESRGLKTERGEERRALQARNAERQELQAEAKIIDFELERLKRQPQAAPTAPAPAKPDAGRRGSAGGNRRGSRHGRTPAAPRCKAPGTRRKAIRAAATTPSG